MYMFCEIQETMKTIVPDIAHQLMPDIQGKCQIS